MISESLEDEELKDAMDCDFVVDIGSVICGFIAPADSWRAKDGRGRMRVSVFTLVEKMPLFFLCRLFNGQNVKERINISNRAPTGYRHQRCSISPSLDSATG